MGSDAVRSSMWIGTGTSMIKAGVLRFTPVMTGSDRAVHPFGGKEPGLQLAQAYAAGCSSCSGPYPCSKSVLGPKRGMPEARFEMTEKSSSVFFRWEFSLSVLVNGPFFEGIPLLVAGYQSIPLEYIEPPIESTIPERSGGREFRDWQVGMVPTINWQGLP